jgi:hypothetical protein
MAANFFERKQNQHTLVMSLVFSSVIVIVDVTFVLFLFLFLFFDATKILKYNSSRSRIAIGIRATTENDKLVQTTILINGLGNENAYRKRKKAVVDLQLLCI